MIRSPGAIRWVDVRIRSEHVAITPGKPSGIEKLFLKNLRAL